MREGHDICGTECQRVREPKIQVVDEEGPRVGRHDVRVHVTRKSQIGRPYGMVGTLRGAAAVELPVQQCEHDVVPDPHQRL